jgi:serine/threonine protein phosphatase PrpC
MSSDVNALSNQLLSYGLQESIRECSSLPFRRNSFFNYKNVKHSNDLKTKVVFKQEMVEKMHAPIPISTDLKREYIKLTQDELTDKFTKDSSDTLSKAIGAHTVFTAANQGSRSKMEDTFLATLLKVRKDDSQVEIPTFMLFDGHGGTKKSCKCSAFLASKFEKILKENFKGIDLTDEMEVKFSFKASFLAADALFKKKYPRDLSGSTALVALVIANKLYVANAGDSRAILSSGSQAFQLSEDAVCTDEPFKSSIIKRGGDPRYYYYEFKTDDMGRFCLKENGDFIRIKYVNSQTNPFDDIMTVDTHDNPVKIPVHSKYEKQIFRQGRKETIFLAPGRAIGDLEFPEVTARPKVKIFDLNQLNAKENTFLILACDGVWDVLNTLEVSTSAQKSALDFTEIELQTQAVAKTILRKSFKRDTQDNVTVMAVKLSIPQQADK